MGHAQELNKIADRHSYIEGFNGALAEYRHLTAKRYIDAKNSGGSALEIGAGEGANISFISRFFGRLVALEPAENYFRKLSQNRPRGVEHVKETFEAFHTHEKFDAIFMFGVLEHVKRPVGFLHKAGKMLKHSGSIYITVPNCRSLHRQLGKALGLIHTIDELTLQDKAVGHYRYYSQDTLWQDVHDAKLKWSGGEGIMFKPYPNSQMQLLDRDVIRELFVLGSEVDDWCAEIFAVVEKR